jgi:hypothetical protein
MRYTKNVWLAGLLLIALILSACNVGQEPEPTPDVGAIFTAAAETVQAQFSLELTQTALAAPTATQPPLPPTATPFPTFAVDGSPAPAASPVATLGVGTQPTTGVPGLATATSLAVLATQPQDTCMNSAWIQDVTYDDTVEKPVLKANKRVLKIWRVQNTGTCAWDDGFVLVQYSGDNMDASKWEIKKKADFVDPGEIVDISVELTVPSKKGEHGGCWRMKGDNDFYFGTSLCFNFLVE